MQCPVCRSDIEQGAKFCTRCGARLQPEAPPPGNLGMPPAPTGGEPVYEGARPREYNPPPIGGSPYGYGPPPPPGDYGAYQATQSASGPAPEFVIQPLGLGELFDAALKIYFKHFKLIFAATAVVGIPLAIAGALFQGAMITPEKIMKNPAAMAGGIIVALCFVLLAILGASVQRGAIAKIISDIYLSRPTSLGAAYGAAFRKIWVLIFASILYGFAYLLGMMACLVPGIYLGVAMSLYIYVIMCEDKGIVESLSRSMDLIKGHWFKLFTVLFLMVVLGAMIGSIPGLFTGVLGATAGPSSMRIVMPVTSFITSLVQMLVTPIGTIIYILFYYDLRVRKEGFDLEIMAREIG